jgi:hypothetical protein
LQTLVGNLNLSPVLTARVQEKLSLTAAPESASSPVAEPAIPPPVSAEAGVQTPTPENLANDSLTAHVEGTNRAIAEPVGQTDKPIPPVESAAPAPSPSVQSSPATVQTSQRTHRIIDEIRRSAFPSNMMQFAARGALMVPPEEMIEILVHLANHNTVFGGQAKLTLAGWNVKSCRDVLANPASPKEILEYFIDPANLRPALLPALLENPSLGEDLLLRLATSATREQAEILVDSPRVSHLPSVLQTLVGNLNLSPVLTARVQEKLSLTAAPESASSPVAEPAVPPPVSAEEEVQTATCSESQTVTSSETRDDVRETDEEAIDRFMAEHAGEIAAEVDIEFAPVEEPEEESEPSEAVAAQAATASAGGDPGQTKTSAQTKPKKTFLKPEEHQGSALQKIAKLDIKGRILLAMKGNKEERSLLVRDGTKIVALAVLESPRITDGEVERFAGQKNLLEAVLRAISMKRRFIKQYPIVRNLTFNPRTPIDVSLGLMKNLLVQDLRHLSGNKEVSDTVRKLAAKMFRQKAATTKKS